MPGALHTIREVEGMPLGELRRRDREMGQPQAEELLARALVGRIATVGPEGMPYVVPMHFVYEASTRHIYFHCATSGHLLSNLAHSDLACFEVDEPGEFIATAPLACGTSQVYTSAICFGKARVVTEEGEKVHGLRLFVKKYVDGLTPERQYAPEMETIDDTTVIALRVDRITGKQRKPA